MFLMFKYIIIFELIWENIEVKIFDNIKLEIEEGEILHLLGYRDTLPDENVLKRITFFRFY